jgi:hypothetical protein
VRSQKNTAKESTEKIGRYIYSNRYANHKLETKEILKSKA